MSGLTSDDMDLIAEAVSGRVGPGWIRVNCPVCDLRTGKPDARQSLAFNTATGGFKCWKCAAQSKLHSWVPTSSEPEAPAEDEPPAPIEPAHEFIPLWQWPGDSAAATRPYIDYLMGPKRGLTAEAIAGAQIGCAVRGPLAGRVIVPHLVPGLPEWAGWIARDAEVLPPRQLKYRYSRGMHRDHLWNEAALGAATSDPLLLVEGVFDGLPYWPNASGFLGKPTREHVERLQAHRGRPLIVALDGDAWQEAQGLALKLQFLGAPASWLKLPPGEDPCSVDRQQLWEAALFEVAKLAVSRI